MVLLEILEYDVVVPSQQTQEPVAQLRALKNPTLTQLRQSPGSRKDATGRWCDSTQQAAPRSQSCPT